MFIFPQGAHYPKYFFLYTLVPLTAPTIIFSPCPTICIIFFCLFKRHHSFMAIFTVHFNRLTPTVGALVSLVRRSLSFAALDSVLRDTADAVPLLHTGDPQHSHLPRSQGMHCENTCTLQRNMDLFIPRKGIARTQSNLLYIPCVCERPTYFPAPE